ncbi:S100P-binding protein isoform X1 [Cyanistes caeruleus]|uniref:S100P-binding protein isoform X1 n=1 Tax=Cyanistes caeruleus TaxID=156563 RepID=UPI000CDB9977|nr:S100P-binding protein isoform X1 [Cyanistes caeruleus]XP_023797006.1 S100P-binding protein isoform X1 [Cyanistes caeruleus]XP_023797007.1 S100P-binding protein isoform X1 [Cyanistes caeruleus]
MGDSSPASPGLCQEFRQDPLPRAKRLSDSAVQVQALQSAKKACVLRRGCSTPDPAGNLLFPSPSSGCSLFLEESAQDEFGASFSVPKYDDVAISLDISGCFDDSELDDSLLELSGSEKGNSPFDYTEEEIQEILADDSMEAEQQHLAGESHLSQSVSGESDKTESSGCTAGTLVSEAASEVTEEPEEPQEHPSGSSGCDPGFLGGNAALDGSQLQVELDLDLQELLSLSPFAAACAGEALEENNLERETLDAMIDDCLGYSTAAGSCSPEKSTERVMPKGWESVDQDCLGRAMPSSNLPCGQSTGDESPASLLPPKKELPKATTSCSSRKSGLPKDAEGESTGAEQPPGSTKLSDAAVGQTGQEEPTSGKKSGKVIPVPQEKEERPKQRTCISEAQPEQKKRFSPGCGSPSEEKCGYNLRQWELLCMVRVCLGEPPFLPNHPWISQEKLLKIPSRSISFWQ